MEVLQVTSRKRETYEVDFTYSPLWECALGIAAITNSRLLNTLEKPINYWKDLRGKLSNNLIKHLKYVEENNTWKAILQLLHRLESNTLNEFSTNVELLENTKFKFICLPYIGENFEHLREKAAVGDKNAILELKAKTNESTFFPQYIEFLK